MPSTGNYIYFFVHTTKINTLKFWLVISYSLQDSSICLQKLDTQTKKTGGKRKNTEEHHNAKKILKSIFRHPGNPRF